MAHPLSGHVYCPGSKPLMPQDILVLAVSLTLAYLTWLFSFWELHTAGVLWCETHGDQLEESWFIFDMFIILESGQLNSSGNVIQHAIVIGLWRWRGATTKPQGMYQLFHLSVCDLEMKWASSETFWNICPMEMILGWADPSLDFSSSAQAQVWKSCLL